MTDVFLRLAVGVAFGLAVWFGVDAFATHHHQLGVLDGRAEMKAMWDAEKIVQQRQALDQLARNATETQRRTDAMQRNIDEAKAMRDRALADRDAAVSSRDRLRRDQAAYLAAATAHTGGPACDSASASGGQAAVTAARVFSDLFSEADEEAGGLAVAFDLARSAGLACERAYRSLTISLRPK